MVPSCCNLPLTGDNGKLCEQNLCNKARGYNHGLSIRWGHSVITSERRRRITGISNHTIAMVIRTTGQRIGACRLPKLGFNGTIWVSENFSLQYYLPGYLYFHL